MLSDYEATDIERRIREGEKGPVALTWVEKLLQDRRERLQQQTYLRQRVKQAFEYLDGLLKSSEKPAASTGRVCPKCGEAYHVARPHPSSRGKIYVHPDRKESLVNE